MCEGGKGGQGIVGGVGVSVCVGVCGVAGGCFAPFGSGFQRKKQNTHTLKSEKPRSPEEGPVKLTGPNVLTGNCFTYLLQSLRGGWDRPFLGVLTNLFLMCLLNNYDYDCPPNETPHK